MANKHIIKNPGKTTAVALLKLILQSITGICLICLCILPFLSCPSVNPENVFAFDCIEEGDILFQNES